MVRVRADLAAAKALADGAGAAAGAEAAAAKPADVAAMKAALKKLQADQVAAAAAAFAAEAAAPLKTCKEQIDKADKALAKNDGKGAAGPLAAAAKALVEAKAIQVAQNQFTSTLPSVEARLTALQALPRAAVLKGVIDPVAKALADAKAKNKAKAGVEAMAALRSAIDLAAAATKADARARQVRHRLHREHDPRRHHHRRQGEEAPGRGLADGEEARPTRSSSARPRRR